MEKRTIEIIMLLKGHSMVKPTGSVKETFKKYVSYLFDCPEEYYTDDDLWSIVREAVMDALSSCSNPGQVRQFMYNVFESRKWYDELESYITALKHMQVRENNKFINGFSGSVLKEIGEQFYLDRYEITVTSDAFPDPEDAYAIWDHRDECYYADIYSGKVYTYPTAEEAEKGLKELIEKLTN